MRDDRTPAWWPTRILLVVGFVATVVVFAGAITQVLVVPSTHGPEPTVLGLPRHLLWDALWAAIAVFGLVWMLRIFRGPRDKPPPWRHR